MTEIQNIKSASDMELWVQDHGYGRFCQAMVNGEFKGSTLRIAREWDINRSERRKRRLALGLAAILTAAALGVMGIYVAPVLLSAAGH